MATLGPSASFPAFYTGESGHTAPYRYTIRPTTFPLHVTPHLTLNYMPHHTPNHNPSHTKPHATYNLTTHQTSYHYRIETPGEAAQLVQVASL